jgi:polyvinyl alcohol dehydrogenase (cytochrome)
MVIALPAVTWASDCPSTPGLDFFYTDGWGFGPDNHRFQQYSDIDRDNVDQLKLRWTFALDEGQSPHSYPTVSGDTVFIGTDSGNLYALDRDSGCTRWQYAAGEPIRTAVVHGALLVNGKPRVLLFFGTGEGFVHAVDAASGARVWRTEVRDHPYALVTGSPRFHEGKLIVPVSSVELALAISPFYGCCKFRGSLVTLDAASGEPEWRTHTISEPLRVTGRHFWFVEHWGPSGAPIWSSPAVSAELGLVFAGTGENYTSPATDTSDAILALDAADGTLRWSKQFTAEDAFNMACSISVKHPNCPPEAGPDFDFGAPPVIVQARNGDQLVLAGQKSGGVYAMDARTGKRRWEQQLGRGGWLGGVHWGMALDRGRRQLYVPISDVAAGPVNGEAAPGVYALDLETGTRLWSARQDSLCEGREGCRDGFSAAPLATDELVFAAMLDGQVTIFDAANGDLLWQYDSWRDFEAVNGLAARGGAIDVHGPLVAGRQLIIQSGYGSFGQRGGNALLVFELPAEASP